jgi:protein TonB
MIYAKRRTDPTTRIVGLVMVVVINVIVLVALLSMAAAKHMELAPPPIVEIVQEEIKPEEEPPPPPDVEQPQLQPEVQLQIPDFIVDAPPAPAPVVRMVENPAPPPPPAPPAPPAPAPRPVLPSVRPRADQERFQRMLVDDYPPRALRARQEGDVTLAMCMSVDGRASDVTVVSSSGNDALDEAAVRGVGRLRFTPAKDGSGRPVPWCNPKYQMTVQWRIPRD